jgi:hypothetical protein
VCPHLSAGDRGAALSSLPALQFPRTWQRQVLAGLGPTRHYLGFFFFPVVLEIELRALLSLGRHSAP